MPSDNQESFRGALEMKVCFLTLSLRNTNGWGRYSAELINELARHDVEALVITAKEENSNCLLNANVLPILHRKPTLRSLLANFIILHKYRHRFQEIDLVHVLTEPLLPLATFFSKKPIVVNAIGTYCVSCFRSIKLRWIYRKAYASVTKIIAISRYTAKRLLSELDQEKSLLEIIPLGVSDTFINHKYLSIEERENSFVLVGHVKERKGVIEAIVALSEVQRKFKSAKLYVVGPLNDEDYLGQCKDTVEKLNLQHSVIFRGDVSDEDLIKIMSSVRGLVVPSVNRRGHFEGFGLVHLESHALGTPSIGSLDCGNEDVVEHGRNGYLTKQGNIQELSDALIRLLENDNWESLSSYCRESSKNFLWSNVGAKYLAIYNEICR